ncbi:MAG: glycosyltransferase family 4 protein [Desulfobacterales bacterium]|nr:glycosyltransferase family 4 protein [Desulfobacterales bacterium]
MKILHLNGAASGGGIEQYLGQLFKELGSRGHQNLLIYGDRAPEDAFSKEEARHIEGITRVACGDLDTKIEKVKEIFKSYDPDLVFVHQVLNAALIDFVTRRKPSIRFAHGYKLICPDGRKTLKSEGRLCGYPLGYSCQIHAYQYRCMPRDPFKGFRLLRNSKRIVRMHRQRSHMVVASSFMKSMLLQNGFEEDRISIIPYFTHAPDSVDYPPINAEPLIICVGRVIKEKGMHHLIKALSSVHQRARLIIVGDGPDLKGLEGLGKDLGLSERIDFKGWLSHDRLDRLYRECSIAVVPSVWPEPFGIVGIEAMAYQRPVIACNVGGISDWLNHEENGFLVKVGDEGAIAEKINFLIENPEAAKRMGEEARVFAKNRFSVEAHMGPLLSLFKKLTGDL